jgi:hypothetical protein
MVSLPNVLREGAPGRARRRARRRDDPEAAARAHRQRVGALIAACEARIAAGERLTEQETKLLRAHQRVSEARA